MLRLAVLIAALVATPLLARDDGQWEETSPEIRQWYRGLMQPDVPEWSCCGEADAYYADSFEVEGDQYVAIITDTREDGPLNRPHVKPGTRVIVPNNKLKYDAGNPTGHGVIFMSRGAVNGASAERATVYCYVVPGGV